MGIQKSKKGRNSFLGSISVTDLKAEKKAPVQQANEPVQVSSNENKEPVSQVTNPNAGTHMPIAEENQPKQTPPAPAPQSEAYMPSQPYPSTGYQQPMQAQMPEQPYYGYPNPMPGYQRMMPEKKKPGRKTKILIAGDAEKPVYLKLPASLVDKIQEHARMYNLSTKEVIGNILIEKFMK